MNYNCQKSFTHISFAIFSSIYLIFPLTYFYDQILDFNQTIKIPYNNIEEMIFFSSIFFILTLLYFYDKIKFNQIYNKKLLILQAFIQVNCAYFSTKLAQTYNPFSIYAFIFLILSIVFLILSFNQKENKNIILIFKTLDSLYYILLYTLAFIIAFIGILFLPLEFIILFKRNSQILTGLILDKKSKNINFLLKDLFIVMIIIMISIFIYFYYY